MPKSPLHFPIAWGCLLALAAGTVVAQQQGTSRPEEEVTALVARAPERTESALDGCVQIHHLWKAQVLALAEPDDRREPRLVSTVYATNQNFWAAYLGNEAAFTKWIRGAKPLPSDARFTVPTRLPLATTIVDTVRRMEQFSSRRACGEWFVLYGPGWTNMGGLGNDRMVLDLFGLSTTEPIEDVRRTLPHELNHLIFDKTRTPEEWGTLLHRMLDEGFASFVADQYWGPEFTGREALGYSVAEWTWAIEHESTLWAQARTELNSKDRKVLDTFSSAGTRIADGAPGKIGYFLGYRIVDDFVQRNGPESWRKLYDMRLADILAATRFSTEP